MKNCRFFVQFFLNTSKFQRFYKFRWFNRKNHIKIYQNTTSFYSKVDLKLFKNRFFLVRKGKIHVIAFMIMLTRFSERIFNTTRYAGMYLFLVIKCVTSLSSDWLLTSYVDVILVNAYHFFL